jgi:hypothetical protein
MINRRTLLRGAAGAVISLPWLSAMAQPPEGRPQRFVATLIPNGVVARDWYPIVEGDTWRLNRTMEPLAPHKDDLLVFRGVHNRAIELAPGENHWQGTFSMLTGRPIIGGNSGPYFASGQSLDQAIAQRVGQRTRLGSLELSTESHTLVSLAWDGERRARLPRTRPLAVFTALFGAPGGDPAAVARRIARRQSILDRVGDDFRALVPRIAAEDRPRLEAHLDAIRDVEQRLTFAGQCGTPAYGFGEPVDADWYRTMIDLLVLAFQCDTTRVATIVYRHAGGGGSYFPWLPGLRSAAEGGSEAERQALYAQFEHHEMSHSDDRQGEKLHAILRWFNEQTAYLLQRLKDTPEGDGTLFDSLVYLQGSDCGLGNHTMQNIPFVLAGRGNGAFRTGRFVDYPQGVAHNRLLIAIMNAFGIQGDVFGDERVCEGGALDLS